MIVITGLAFFSPVYAKEHEINSFVVGIKAGLIVGKILAIPLAVLNPTAGYGNTDDDYSVIMQTPSRRSFLLEAYNSKIQEKIDKIKSKNYDSNKLNSKLSNPDLKKLNSPSWTFGSNVNYFVIPEAKGFPHKFSGFKITDKNKKNPTLCKPISQQRIALSSSDIVYLEEIYGVNVNPEVPYLNKVSYSPRCLVKEDSIKYVASFEYFNNPDEIIHMDYKIAKNMIIESFDL